LADLKDAGQEFLCAQLIDSHPKVKHWVRNLDTAPCGFWLPTSKGRFFPDFVVELTNGRIVVIEFKGAHLTSDPYEIEKKQVGLLWAGASQGKAVFDWALMTQGGLSLSQQLDRLLA
jgi:type III restriction enzyme